jgi:hypothetical protein
MDSVRSDHRADKPGTAVTADCETIPKTTLEYWALIAEIAPVRY